MCLPTLVKGLSHNNYCEVATTKVRERDPRITQRIWKFMPLQNKEAKNIFVA
jgi:hypothetical protein